MFDISRDSEIYFYGRSKFDMVADKHTAMESEGYRVKGFIDRDAKKINREVPCWSLREFLEKEKNNENAVVIFLLQNAQQHEEIACRFVSEGFGNILFVPSRMDTEEKKKMLRTYNSFLEGDYESLCDIPKAGCVLSRGMVCTKPVQTGKKYDIYFVPAELLFSYDKQEYYGNQNVRYCLPYLELFEYLSGERETCERYLDYMGKEDGEIFLKDREKMFLNFERERNLGTDYFVETAAFVKWNEKGYFNVIDGHHRVTYLAYKGYLRIPVRIEKEDVLKWSKREETKENNFCELPCPIPLPGYLESGSMYEPRWHKVTDFFFHSLIVQEKKGLHFIEADRNFGYYARYFERAGWFKSFVVLKDKGEIEKCRCLNHLLRQHVLIVPQLQMGIQAAYIDMDVVEKKQLIGMLGDEEFSCLVFETIEKNGEENILMVQNAMNSSVQFICSYYYEDELKKIYGIIR